MPDPPTPPHPAETLGETYAAEFGRGPQAAPSDAVPVPPQAITAAEEAFAHMYRTSGRTMANLRKCIQAALEAAGPHLAAAERARLADRQQMVDEVKAELDDAFQFTERDGSRHGHVTREWVQVLIATQAASAAAAEREACARLAEQVDAFYDAPCPDGDPGCVHQDTPFASLLRKENP